MAAPIVYRWDDANAPVARGQRRSLCDILYACLVTGYGSKPAAGWTRPYVNATFDKAAFRNSPTTGTGFYLQVDGAGAAVENKSLVQGFEAMTSESSGLFPFYATIQTAYQSYSADTTARPWVLIADDRAFYFFCWANSSEGTQPSSLNSDVFCMFFGDIVKHYQDDAYACALSVGQNYNRGPVGILNSPSVASASLLYQGYCFPRQRSGVATPIVSAMIRGAGPGGDAHVGTFGPAYTQGGVLFISRPHINEAVAYTLRGWLPGYYYPCHPLAFDQLAQISSDGMSFLSLRHNIYTTPGNSFLSLDDWRA